MAEFVEYLCFLIDVESGAGLTNHAGAHFARVEGRFAYGKAGGHLFEIIAVDSLVAISVVFFDRGFEYVFVDADLRRQFGQRIGLINFSVGYALPEQVVFPGRHRRAAVIGVGIAHVLAACHQCRFVE